MHPVARKEGIRLIKKIFNSFILLIAIVLCLFISAYAETVLIENVDMTPGEAPEKDIQDRARSYTLEQSIKRGISVNPRMRAAESELRKAESDVKIRRGDYLPSFSAQSYFEKIDNLYSKGDADTDYIDQDITGVTFRLSQPLFSGMTIFNSHQKSLLEKARVEAWKQQQQNDLILEIQLHFLELLKAREDVKSLRDAVTRLEKGVEAAEAFHERRMAPYTQVLQAYVDLADARNQLSQAENRIDTTSVQLNILLGFSVYRDIDYIGTLEKQLVMEKNFEECLEYAYAHRPELEVVQKGIEMAEKDRMIVMGQFSPRLSATVDYHIRDVDYDEPGISFGQTFDRDRRNEYWTAGIRLQWDFGLGAQQYHQYSKAGHESQRLRYSREEMRNQVIAEVRTYFMNLRESAGRIDTAAAGVDHARQGYNMAQQRFEVRMGTISELLDAQARLSRAEAGYNQAIADYLSTMARLYHAMGMENYSLADAY